MFLDLSSKDNLTDEQHQSIFEYLLMQSNNEKLKRDCQKAVAATFLVSAKTVHRIWQRRKTCIVAGSFADVTSRKPKNIGPKQVEIDPHEIAKIPLRRRTNIRSMFSFLHVPKSILHRRIKEDLIKPHTNALKALLTEDAKRLRLQYCLSMLKPVSLESDPNFKHLYSCVHIDEKWFYLTQELERYYLLPEEDELLRTCQNKRFITKVMFLAVVARPRFDVEGNETFSCKVGNFPFPCKEPAKRKSKNREAGTLETKSILVTKSVVRSCLIDKVLPAIKSKWPRSDVSKPIYIQQDNARPHIHSNDAEFLEAATKDGFDIRLMNQPPNSPDMNVLDLGYFRAIQSGTAQTKV